MWAEIQITILQSRSCAGDFFNQRLDFYIVVQWTYVYTLVLTTHIAENLSRAKSRISALSTSWTPVTETNSIATWTNR